MYSTLANEYAAIMEKETQTHSIKPRSVGIENIGSKGHSAQL